ncbi:glycosyltransferase family 4 protein [Micromonospora sp. C95]|uniref:glycosyltransferase family 4 protein n=1 Tax=Micromonospora sp. C95 TaxID=2824882 RepID=UPI001B37728D|nr:glycosyltransferase family 4 protein [Micromonospora sp. C95]MBQ1024158.1 glycosyltransferase family 4 protein [Micromonospora sp. C95]
MAVTRGGPDGSAEVDHRRTGECQPDHDPIEKCRVPGWIAYVTANSFPWGEAGSRRVNGMARSLAVYGHKVVVVSGRNPTGDVSTLTDVEGPGSVSHLGLGDSFGDRAPGLRAWLGRGRNVIEWLDAQPTRPSHVVVYGGGAQYAARLHRWCVGNRVPLVADVADWPDRRHVRGGVVGPGNLTVKAALRHYYPQFDGVIVISSFLQQFYSERGCQVLRVPPTLDAVNARRDDPPERSGAALSLVYFGTPAKKDLVATMIRAVEQVVRHGGDVELRVLGPSLAEVQDLLGGMAPPSAVRVMGRLPQWDVAWMLARADFSIIVRRPTRLAHAGFPTKFCESVAAGTPVIANLTTDLGGYLTDGVEGIVCADHSVGAVEHALWRALRLHPDERRAMRQAARKRALESFDYRNYGAELGRFLRQLRRTAGQRG